MKSEVATGFLSKSASLTRKPIYQPLRFSRFTGDLEHFGSYFSKVIQGVLICTPRHYLGQDR